MNSPISPGLRERTAQTLHQLVCSARVAYYLWQARRLQAAADNARRFARNTFLNLRSTDEERRDAMAAWQDAGALEDASWQYATKIREVTRAPV